MRRMWIVVSHERAGETVSGLKFGIMKLQVQRRDLPQGRKGRCSLIRTYHHAHYKFPD